MRKGFWVFQNWLKENRIDPAHVEIIVKTKTMKTAEAIDKAMRREFKELSPTTVDWPKWTRWSLYGVKGRIAPPKDHDAHVETRDYFAREGAFDDLSGLEEELQRQEAAGSR